MLLQDFQTVNSQYLPLFLLFALLLLVLFVVVLALVRLALLVLSLLSHMDIHHFREDVQNIHDDSDTSLDRFHFHSRNDRLVRLFCPYELLQNSLQKCKLKQMISIFSFLCAPFFTSIFYSFLPTFFFYLLSHPGKPVPL